MQRFPDGARVCFVGDSLVAQNQYVKRIIDYYGKNFPDSGIRFFNCGVAGGSYFSAVTFFEDDVLIHDPTHVVVAFGVNDSWRGHLDWKKSAERLAILKGAYDRFRENAECFVEKVLAKGIHLTLCTPAPYDEYTEGDTPPLRGGFALMLGYADFIRTLADRRGIELLDYHEALSTLLETEADVFSPDRVHPTAHGYYLMAKIFLAHQGLTAEEEAPIPDYFAEWELPLRRLRDVYGAEHMLIGDYALPMEEKMAKIRHRLEVLDGNAAVIERFGGAFLRDGDKKAELNAEILRLYERDIFEKYAK